jgi:hypothetical protein
VVSSCSRGGLYVVEPSVVNHTSASQRKKDHVCLFSL